MSVIALQPVARRLGAVAARPAPRTSPASRILRRRGQRLAIQADGDDVAQFQVRGNRQIPASPSAPACFQVAADALGGGGVDRQHAFAVVELQLLRGADDGLGLCDRSVGVRSTSFDGPPASREVAHWRGRRNEPADRSRCRLSAAFPWAHPSGAVRQTTHPAASACLAELSMSAIFKFRSTSTSPVDTSPSRKISAAAGYWPIVAGRHQRPGLHEIARLDGPAIGVQREHVKSAAVLQRTVARVIKRAFGAIAIGPIERRLGNHRRLVVVVRVHHRIDEELCPCPAARHQSAGRCGRRRSACSSAPSRRWGPGVRRRNSRGDRRNRRRCWCICRAGRGIAGRRWSSRIVAIDPLKPKLAEELAGVCRKTGAAARS